MGYRIREFRPGDEAALHAVFHSAVHMLAIRDYTAEQIAAWSPAEPDADFRTHWVQRMRELRPFVVEQDGHTPNAPSGNPILAYADLQANGYIDHFFVAEPYARQGIGSQLMHHLLDTAASRRIAELTADVSRTAQPFFQHFGFVVTEERMPVVRGVAIPNARMRRTDNV